MKKKYIKPSAVIQDMTVNSFAAGLCTSQNGTAVYYAEDTCTYYDEESMSTFFSDQCEDFEKYGEFGVNIVKPNEQSVFAQLCYHRPLDALSFFSS